ncbi:MAG: hypothetical protein PHV32_16340 [Eubacteriales bacterium]|nr:hypothetical protein [Eubacteriales bacterium]
MQTQPKKLSVIAMLSAVAYLIMLVGRIPIVLFLKYDPKDVVITIGGFLFGPLTAFTMSALVSFVEMLTVSAAELRLNNHRHISQIIDKIMSVAACNQYIINLTVVKVITDTRSEEALSFSDIQILNIFLKRGTMLEILMLLFGS